MPAPAVRKVVEDRRFLLAVTCGAALLAFLGPVVAYDVWWHVKAGRMILAERAVPHADPFSFTAGGQPWTYHSWLSGLAIAGVFALGGTAGLVLFRAGMMAAALAISWVAARRRGVGAGLASILVLAACLQLKLRALARPYLFSFVLFMLFAVILQDCAAAPRPKRKTGRWLEEEDAFLWGPGGRLVLLPLLTILWANLHAGFISGLLMIGAFGAGEIAALWAERGLRRLPAGLLKGPDGARFRAMLVAGVLCLAASVVTPYGPGTLMYPFRLLREVKLVKRVQEWQPMPRTMEYGIFWAVLIIGGLIWLRSAYLAFRSRRREQVGPVVTDFLLMAGFACLALQGARNMAWVLLLAPSVLGRQVMASRRMVSGDAAGEAAGPRPLYAYVACLLALVVGLGPFVRSGLPSFGTVEGRFPVEACNFMEDKDLDYRAFNAYEWGGYMIWRLWPDVPVFVDGRCLVYGDRIMGQALQVEAGEGDWAGILAEHDTEMLVLRYHKRDAAHFFADSRWRCVYWDDLAIVALREDVLRQRGDPLRDFPLTNPAVFEQSLASAPPGEMLREVEAVLARDPECWTAHSARARVLLRQGGALDAARAAAEEAVEILPGYYGNWEVLHEVAVAQGDGERAAEAAERIEALKPANQTAD